MKALARRHAGASCPAMPRLHLFQVDTPNEAAGLVYEPVVCLVLQGRKRTFIGDDILEYGPGECLVVAAEVAAMGQVIEATPAEPFLCLNLLFDPAVISTLLHDMDGLTQAAARSGYGVTQAGPPLLEAWRRLAELLDRPDEVHVMSRHVEQELIFRLLMGRQGNLLRQISATDSSLSRIRRAMAFVRQRHADRLTVNAMASVAGMSVSVFHRRFKAVSGLSPLQYQKHVRLHEARRRLTTEQLESAAVAYAVGYESASQFSREYRRLFGAPPRRDADALRKIMVQE